MPEHLKIPKHAVAVELSDGPQRTRTVHLFLADTSNPLERGERLQDLFSNRRFLPVQNGTRTEFLNTEHIPWLRIPLMEAFDELDAGAESSDLSTIVRVNVTLEDRSIIEGDLRFLMPEESRRTGDYLESVERLLQLQTAEWFYLINRRHVVRVAVRDEA